MSGGGLIGPVLVTGGSGFLGGALCAALAASGEIVIAADLGDTSIRPPDVAYERCDILDAEALYGMCERHGVRAIVHLAAMVIPACKANPRAGAEVNIIGHLNLLEVARRLSVPRFLYTSSIAAKPRGTLDSPVNLYGAYKRCCEDISKIYYLDHGQASIGLRPNVVYGPGREQGETAAITLAIKAAALRERYEMPFAASLCMQHVDEVVDVMIRCLRAEHDGALVSDITTGAQTLDELIAVIRDIEPDADIMPSRNQRPSPPVLDNSPLLALIGDWPGVSLEDGVARTFRYYRGSD